MVSTELIPVDHAYLSEQWKKGTTVVPVTYGGLYQSGYKGFLAKAIPDPYNRYLPDFYWVKGTYRYLETGYFNPLELDEGHAYLFVDSKFIVKQAGVVKISVNNEFVGDKEAYYYLQEDGTFSRTKNDVNHLSFTYSPDGLGRIPALFFTKINKPYPVPPLPVLGEELNNSGWFTVGNDSVTEFATVNGWENFGGDLYYPLQYCRKYGTVYLRGVVKSGVVGDGKVIFTLPTKYRPKRKLLFPVVAGFQSGVLAIEPNGDVYLVHGDNNFVSLEVSYYIGLD